MPHRKVLIYDIPEFSLGKKFGILSRSYFALLSGKLEHLGIKKSFSVLVLIDKMGEDQCSQKFIADTLRIDKTMMVGVLDELAEAGFIKRIQNPTDRRQHWIQLTDKGKKQMPEIKRTIKQLNESVLEGLTASDVTKFYKQLGTIYKNMQTISKLQHLA